MNLAQIHREYVEAQEDHAGIVHQIRQLARDLDDMNIDRAQTRAQMRRLRAEAKRLTGRIEELEAAL